MKIQKSNNFDSLFSSNVPDGAFEDHVPELKKNVQKEAKTKDQSWRSLENQKAMTRSAEGDLGANRVLNSGVGGEKNESNSLNNMGMSNQNSIWDSGKLQSLSNTPSDDEKTAQEKDRIKKVRAGWEEDRLTQMAESVIENALDSGVKNVSTKDASVGKRDLPTNGISIFDDSDFQRVPEKTAGEKLKDKPVQAKDESWKTTGASTKLDSTNFFDNLINRLQENKSGE